MRHIRVLVFRFRKLDRFINFIFVKKTREMPTNHAASVTDQKKSREWWKKLVTFLDPLISMFIINLFHHSVCLSHCPYTDGVTHLQHSLAYADDHLNVLIIQNRSLSNSRVKPSRHLIIKKQLKDWDNLEDNQFVVQMNPNETWTFFICCTGGHKKWPTYNLIPVQNDRVYN